jgi:hypothetical protein
MFMTIRMKAFVRLFCAMAAMAVLSVPAHSQENQSAENRDKRMEIEFRYWFVNSRASVSAVDSAAGTMASAKAGLGLTSNGAPEARYSLRITGRHKLKIDYAQLSTNSSTADFAINFGGSDALSGENIDISSLGSAKLDIKQLKIGYSWQGIKLGNRIRLGPLVDVRAILFDASITAGDSPERRSGMLGTGMLTLGAEATASLHRRVEVNSTLSFIPITGLGRVLEADTAAKLSLSNNFNLSLGYRYLRFRVGDGPGFAELRIRGPVFGGGFRF